MPLAIPVQTLEPLRCQQTLEPLINRSDGLYSPAADILYPVRDGLVFMGYDERATAFYETVIAEESDHQTSDRHFERDLAFLRRSSVAVLDAMKLLAPHQRARVGLKCLEVGAGSGWVSWFFARAGYDSWLCELDPNSLSISWLYAQPRLAAGKRVVSDAGLLPFADRAFDLVVCKEFAHHVANKDQLFAETNRVLRPGGLLLMLEPVRSVISTLYDFRHPDPHSDHVIVWPGAYVRAVKRHGFAPLVRAAYHYRDDGRFRALAHWRAACNMAARRGIPRDDVRTRCLQYLFGGSMILVGAKTREVPHRSRPRVRVVDPATLRIGPEVRERYRPFLDVLREAEPQVRQPEPAAL